MVAGGYKGGYLSTTELLYPGASAWVFGKNLYSPLAFVTTVSLETSVLLIGDILLTLVFTTYSYYPEVVLGKMVAIARYFPLMEPGNFLGI